jgi:hypothetical protein
MDRWGGGFASLMSAVNVQAYVKRIGGMCLPCDQVNEEEKQRQGQ